MSQETTRAALIGARVKWNAKTGIGAWYGTIIAVAGDFVKVKPSMRSANQFWAKIGEQRLFHHTPGIVSIVK